MFGQSDALATIIFLLMTIYDTILLLLPYNVLLQHFEESEEVLAGLFGVCIIHRHLNVTTVPHNVPVWYSACVAYTHRGNGGGVVVREGVWNITSCEWKSS